MRRWGIALAIAALAAALQWAIRPGVATTLPFLFFAPAIVLAAAYAGRNVGLGIAEFGLLNAVLLLWRQGDGGLTLAVADEIGLAVYVPFSILLALLGARMRLSSDRASTAEQRLVLAGEDTGIGIFELDLLRERIDLSPALATLFGVGAGGPVPAADLLARLPADVVIESRAILAQKLRERALAYERELKVVAADGTPRWLLLRVHLVWVGERAVRLRGACIDVTERRAVDALLDRTQTELSQQVADLHRLHELSSQLLETTDLPRQLALILGALAEFHGTRRGLITLVGPGRGTAAIAASAGFDGAAVARLGVSCAGDRGDAQAGAGHARRVIADTEHATTSADLRRLAREHGFRALHGTPLIGQHGDVLGALTIHLDQPRAPSARECTLADICARKAAIFVERARAQAALEESQGRFQAVLDASAVPFVVLGPQRDADGVVRDFEWLYVNEAAARALRHPAETFIGRRVQDVLPARWSSSESFHQYVAVVDEDITREFETHVRQQGRDEWFHCVASPMRGQVALWFTDVTARKTDERLLKDADRRKDEFLATLAHELRNPLAPIRQAAAIWRLPQSTPAQKHWAHEVVDRQVRHMALLLDDLLDVSRITRGVLALRRGTHALGDMLEVAVETARPLVEARRHELELVLPQATILMQADPLRVAQIVANLLTNAAKYTDLGGHLRLLAALDADDVVIEVADNGIGIAEESLPAVFAMFTQLRGVSDRAGGGLGIGLALTKGLVELHGGSIAVRSAGVGAGSVFTVRLPRGETPALLQAAVRDVEPRAVSARRILVADDNRDAAESLATLLRLEGHEVTLAFDGEAAFEAYERVRPQICLLDIGMPRSTGNEVASRIRAGIDGARPRLVAITGWGQESDRRQALDAGFDHHLTKPIDPAALLRLIADADADERDRLAI